MHYYRDLKSSRTAATAARAAISSWSSMPASSLPASRPSTAERARQILTPWCSAIRSCARWRSRSPSASSTPAAATPAAGLPPSDLARLAGSGGGVESDPFFGVDVVGSEMDVDVDVDVDIDLCTLTKASAASAGCFRGFPPPPRWELSY